MMELSRMNVKSVASSLVTFVVGVILIAIIVSFLLGMMVSPRRNEPRTIIVERPNYRGWWGHYGAGLPGWGGHVGPRYPPPPPPHPKPPAQPTP